MDEGIKAEAKAAEARSKYFRNRAIDHERLARDFRSLADECAKRAADIRDGI
jgi:hypothetical protein